MDQCSSTKVDKLQISTTKDAKSLISTKNNDKLQISTRKDAKSLFSTKNDDKLQTSNKKMNKLKEDENLSAIRTKCIDDCFYYYISNAIWILIHSSESKFDLRKMKSFHRTAFYISKLIKPFHKELYENLRQLKAIDLHRKYKKLSKSKCEEMSSEIFDKDFTDVYKVLKTICKQYLYISILKQLIPEIDPTQFYFKVDIISHNVYKLQRNNLHETF